MVRDDAPRPGSGRTTTIGLTGSSPGMRQRYEAAYGDRYSCPVRVRRGWQVRFRQLCESVGLATRFPWPGRTPPSQTALYRAVTAGMPAAGPLYWNMSIPCLAEHCNRSPRC